MLWKVEVTVKQFPNLSAADTYTVFVAAESEREAEEKAADAVRTHREEPDSEVRATAMGTIEYLVVSRTTGLFAEG